MPPGRKPKAAATGNQPRAQGPVRRSARASKPPQRLGAAAAPAQNANNATTGKRGHGRPKKEQEKNAQGQKRRRAASSDDEDDGDQEENYDDNDEDGRPAKRLQKGPIFNVYFNGLEVTKRRWPKGMSRGNQRPRGGGAAASGDDKGDGDDDDDDDENDKGAGGQKSQSSSRSKWTNFLQAQGSYGYEGWNGLHQEDQNLLTTVAARLCDSARHDFRREHIKVSRSDETV